MRFVVVSLVFFIFIPQTLHFVLLLFGPSVRWRWRSWQTAQRQQVRSPRWYSASVKSQSPRLCSRLLLFNLLLYNLNCEICGGLIVLQNVSESRVEVILPGFVCFSRECCYFGVCTRCAKFWYWFYMLLYLNVWILPTSVHFLFIFIVVTRQLGSDQHKFCLWLGLYYILTYFVIIIIIPHLVF